MVGGVGQDYYEHVFETFKRFAEEYHDFLYYWFKKRRNLAQGWLDGSEMPVVHWIQKDTIVIVEEVTENILLLFSFGVVFFMSSFLAFLVYDPK